MQHRVAGLCWMRPVLREACYHSGMQPQSNQAARLLSRQPHVARQDTLKSIGQHLHQTSARINRLSAAQQRVQEALSAPVPDGVSRIDWIAKKLNGQS